MTVLSTKGGHNFFIPTKKEFLPSELRKDYVGRSLNFAYAMTFGKEGEHRKYRSGGSNVRRNGEVFCDTFQGKLAEYFVYQSLTNMKINCPEPGIETWNLGKWDDEDFSVNQKLINVKSMAYFSNLLLLETSDWDKTGLYIPNKKFYDYFVVVRMRPDIKKEFKVRRILYTYDLSIREIKSVIEKQVFHADIPGYVTKAFLQEVIKTKQILPKVSTLNGKTKMDAENYYILSSDFREFAKIKTELLYS